MTIDSAPRESPFLERQETPETIRSSIATVAFNNPLGWRWRIAFAISVLFTLLFAAAIILLLINGVGLWNNNVPVTWALDIVSYDWWIGIASGALITSAVFVLTGSAWRGAVNRISETGALIAAAAAGLYPIIHLGRPWFFFWNLPYPNTFLLWPQFRSPLFWDAVDIISFLGVAFVMWAIGLLPDLANLRDRAVEMMILNGGRGRLRAQCYGVAALGWRGSARQWRSWTQAYRLSSVLAIVLVISLQMGAAVMFAGSLEPGWHDTLLPIDFLAGAILSGLAFMGAAAVVLRSALRLRHLVTTRHFEVIALLILGFGLITIYCTATEFFSAYVGTDSYDAAEMTRRLVGEHAWAFWTFLICGLVPTQIFWLPRARRSAIALLIVGLLVVTGIYGDHFMVIVVTLQHDFLPSSAQTYAVGVWGVLTLLGSIGLFFTLALLALRVMPVVSAIEIEALEFTTREATNGL